RRGVPKDDRLSARRRQQFSIWSVGDGGDRVRVTLKRMQITLSETPQIKPFKPTHVLGSAKRLHPWRFLVEQLGDPSDICSLPGLLRKIHMRCIQIAIRQRL